MNSDNATLHESVNLYRLVERQRTEKALAALAQLGQHLCTATTAIEAARVIVEVADELLGWDACSFDLYSEETRTTAPILNMDIVAGQRTVVPPAYPGAHLTPTMQRVFTEGGQLILREEAHAAADALRRFGDTSRPSASLMFVAIRSRQRVIGILSIQSYIPHAYDPESLALLQALADHCGGALERIQAEAAEREQRRLAEALRDTAAALSGTLDFDQILDRILIEVGRVVPHDTANVMLIAGDHASIARQCGYAEHHLPLPPLDLRLPVDDTPTLHEMATTGRPCIVSATQTYPGWVHLHENRWIRSYAGAPIRSRGQTLGFLNLNSSTPGFFTPAHTERLQAFADQAGMALENARLLTETQRHANELEQRVAERTTALQAANEKLKELDRFKSQFISDVSHELRTPLTNIRLILDLLVKGRPEKRDQYLATLRRETGMLNSLIEDLLYISRVDLGKVQPKLEPVDLSQLAATLASDRAALFAERGHTLRTDLAAGLPSVSADPKMLTQVLTNLLTNAMNYTPAGGTISISATLQRDDGGKLQAGRGGCAWIALAVSDTGPGIAADEQARLFERFYRGETGRRSGAAGTGLGLAICQELVARHGGQITVASQIGQGSTFTIWLPVPPG